MTDPESRKLSRKERERQRSRDDILEAALAVFGRHGFHRATMEDIAGEAGFSTGALYNYFKNKEDIFASLVRRLMAELEQRFRDSLADPPSFEVGLDRFLASLADFSLHNVAAYRFMLQAEGAPNPDPELHREIFASFWRLLGILTELMEGGLEEGVLRPQEPVAAAHALMALTGHFFRGWVLAQDENGDETLPIEHFEEQVKEYFLYGAAATRPEES